MPKIAIDYSKTIIYKIVCNDLTITDLYVGSTTSFTKRKNQHRYSCNRCENKAYHYNIYKIIRDNGGWDNWSMIQIEEYPCANGNESRSRERYWIEELNAKINVVIPTRTPEEYIEDNKEKIKEQKKIYRENTKDHKKEIDKIYYNTNRDKLIKYANDYRENNVEKKIETNKKYRETNKDEINKKQKENYKINKEKYKDKIKEYREKNKDEINIKQRELRAKQKLEILQKTI